MLGFLTWYPLLAAAIVIGRLLARAREEQTRPPRDDRSPIFRMDGGGDFPISRLTRSDGSDDEWSLAWASAL